MGEKAHHTNYVRVWGILVILLVVSVCGPMLGVKVVTLITAFGIAIVKAYLVAKNFMHLNIERKYVSYLLLTMVGFMLLMFFALAPDIMHHEGQRWVNTAAKESVQRALANPARHGEHGAAPAGGHAAPAGEHAAPAEHH